MIPIKTHEEIRIMREGGRRLRKVLQKVIEEAKPGITPYELNKLAEKLIKSYRGTPSFKEVEDYNWATCICLNDGVVHCPPNKRKLKGGDVLSIDVGMKYQGWHTDAAWTVYIKNTSQKLDIKKFLKTGQLALKKAISQVKPGNRLGHISKAIEETIKEGGYSVVKHLVGHGIGKKLHEPPEVPCFLKGELEKTSPLREGMVLAVEVIYNAGGGEVILDEADGWTIKTKDGKIAALFEKTVAVTRHGPLVLT